MDSTRHGVHVTTLIVCKPLCGHIYSLFLGRYLEVELLGCMVNVCLTFSKNNLIYVFLAVWSSSLCILFCGCGEQGLLSSCGAPPSHWGGFCHRGAWALGHFGFSSCSSTALEHRFNINSCSTRAQPPCRMWDLHRSGTEPMSLAVADGFFTIEPPGKPCA